MKLLKNIYTAEQNILLLCGIWENSTQTTAANKIKSLPPPFFDEMSRTRGCTVQEPEGEFLTCKNGGVSQYTNFYDILLYVQHFREGKAIKDLCHRYLFLVKKILVSGYMYIFFYHKQVPVSNITNFLKKMFLIPKFSGLPRD